MHNDIIPLEGHIIEYKACIVPLGQLSQLRFEIDSRGQIMAQI